MKKFELLAIATLALVVSFFYYGPFLDNFFVFDDFGVLERFISGDFKKMLFPTDMRVFGNLLMWLNYSISGFNPVGYGLIRVVVHIANSLMLFLLLQSLSNNRLLSIFTAIIFVSSSVGCDAVIWKAAFLTMTGFFFYILVLYLYIEGNKSGRRVYHNLALVVFIFAIFNKEEIASIPFMIIFIEMLFFKEDGIYSALKKVVPYVTVIILYILLSFTVSRVFNVHQEQFDRFLSFRPLHSLFSGFASFFISPGGRLNWKDPFIYLTALLVPLSFVLIKDRKILLLGYGWVFITFLPQSFTSLTRYDAPYLFNSISRHLYIPSAGPAMVFALLLLNLRQIMRTKYFILASCLFFVIFIFTNYNRVQDRGEQWQSNGVRMERFLYALKKVQPTFPENSYIHVVKEPTGKAYIQQSLRAFYGNPKIYWVDDPQKLRVKEGDSLFTIYYNRRPGKAIEILQF